MITPPASPASIALIACRVLETEIAAFTRDAAHIRGREFFEIGLHDQPTGLREKLAASIVKAVPTHPAA